MAEASGEPAEPAVSTTTLRLSAAICTRGRPDQLARAVTSLLAQTPLPAEILVVDNAPVDQAICRLVAERFPGVRYVREPIPGLDFARNRALESARHDIVAFLDDDAVAAPGWAESLTRVFLEDPRVAVCTGRVEALSLETESQRLFEANGGFGRGSIRIELPRDAAMPLHGRRAPLIAWAVSVGSGCSYAVRRRFALEAGGFDEALDLGGALPGGGDHDFLWRALRGGATVVYQPQALAWHEHRREVSEVHDQIVGHQRAVVAFLVKHLATARGRERLALAGFLGWRLLKPGLRLIHRAVGRDPLEARALCRMWWNCGAGLLSYRRARRLARTLRERYG